MPDAANCFILRALEFVFLVIVRLCVDAASGGACDVTLIEGVLTMTEWIAHDTPPWMIQQLSIEAMDRVNAKASFGVLWRLARPMARDGCHLVDAIWLFSDIVKPRAPLIANKMKASIFQVWFDFISSVFESDGVAANADDELGFVHFALWVCGTLYETEAISGRFAWRYLPESRRAAILQRFPDDPAARQEWSDQYRARRRCRRAIVNTINVSHGKCTACGRTPAVLTPPLLLCGCGCHEVYCNIDCQRIDLQHAKFGGVSL